MARRCGTIPRTFPKCGRDDAELAGRREGIERTLSLWGGPGAALGDQSTRSPGLVGIQTPPTERMVAERDLRGASEMRRDDLQLRHIDRAWASTVHAFQGRTVDTVIAAMEANHPHLTTQKTLYVEISRARHRAELVTDDWGALRERLEAVTGEVVATCRSARSDRARAWKGGGSRFGQVTRAGARTERAGSLAADTRSKQCRKYRNGSRLRGNERRSRRKSARGLSSNSISSYSSPTKPRMACATTSATRPARLRRGLCEGCGFKAVGTFRDSSHSPARCRSRARPGCAPPRYKWRSP